MKKRRVLRTSATVIGLALAIGLCPSAYLSAQATSDQKPGTSDQKSLYERLGRYDGVAAVVDELLNHMLADSKLAPAFAGLDKSSLARVRQLTVDQVCAATGGPCFYGGPASQVTLANLANTPEQWSATVGHLSMTLASLKIEAPEREDLLATVSRLRADFARPAAPTPAVASVATVATPAPDASSAATDLKAEAIRACLARPQEAGPCLDQLFSGYLKTHSTTDAMAVLRGYEEATPDLRLHCHVIVHALGRQTMVVKRNIKDAFAACDHTCHSGCYHGVMERFIVGDEAEASAARVSGSGPSVAAAGHDHGTVTNAAASGHDHGAGQNSAAPHNHAVGPIARAKLEARVASACDPKEPPRIRFQCMHGLGHAVMFFTDYRIREALAVCDTLPDAWSQRSCQGGVFMENLFASNLDKRDVSPTDLHYPCNHLDPKYRSECYTIQTWRMTEMGLSTERLFEECRKAGAYRLDCDRSIGRDLSNEARTKDPRWAARSCELGRLDEIRACVQGVIYALVDNTWDGRYAMPFCASLSDRGDGDACFERTVQYMSWAFDRSKDDIRVECAARLTFPEACLNATGS